MNNKWINVSLNINLLDKDMSISEVFDFTERDADYVFKFCLSVLLEQDAYDQDEIKEATRIIGELTNNEKAFNISLTKT